MILATKHHFKSLLKMSGLRAVMAVLAISSLLPCKTEHAAEATDSVERQFGQASEGFELSLTFTKDHFAEDEAVTAVLATRNISDRQRSYAGYVPHYVEFLVVDDLGKRVPSREELDPRTSQLSKLAVSGIEIALAPGEEHETRIDLRKYFDLPRGRYTVSATRKVPAIDDLRTRSQVMSGNATFFRGGFKPQEGATRPVQQSNRTNETIVSPKGNPAASTVNVVSNQQQNATNRAIAEPLPPERSQNVDVPTSFAQAQGGQSTKLYWGLGVAALMAVALAVWFVRRKKSAV